MKNFKIHKLDILWVIIIIVLTFGVRFSPVLINDYSKSYDRMYSDSSYTPYTNDPGDTFYYARRIQDFSNGKNALKPLSKMGFDKKMINLSATRDESWARNMFPIIGAGFYKVCSIVGVDDIMVVSTIYTSFLVALAAVLLYLFIKNTTNRLGAMAAAVMISVATPVLLNTSWAHCDTDGILILLPIAMILSLYKSLESLELKNKIIWSVVSVLMYILICLSWTSYEVYYLVLLGLTVAVIAGSFIFKNVFPKKIRLVILGQLIFDTIFSLIIDGSRFIKGVLSIFISSSSGIGAKGNGYPSASKYISELAKLKWVTTDIENIFNTAVGTNINMLGGIAVVLIVIFTSVTLIIMCFRKRNSEDEKYRTIGLQAMIFVSWLIATIMMLFQGQRFLEYILMPLSILFGLGLGYIINYIREKDINFTGAVIIYGICIIVVIGTFMSADTILGIVAFILVIICAIIARNKNKELMAILLTVVLVITPLNGAYKVVKTYRPGLTDIYYETADWIRNMTPPDSLIASWWDYGYFFQCQGDRTTIGHGGVFDGQYFYWLGRGLLTSDYKLSAGIFRMLGNGGLAAQEILTEQFNDSKKESDILAKILAVPRKEAFKILTKDYKIPQDKAEKVIMRTHPKKNRPIYLVITQDMFAKINAIAYYGKWNFDDKHKNYFYATSMTSRQVKKGQSAQVKLVGNGADVRSIRYDVKKDGKISTHLINGKNLEVKVGRYVLIEDEKVKEDKKLFNNDSALVIFKEGDYYSAIVLNDEIYESVMFKLFFAFGVNQNSYLRVNSREISKEYFGDHSEIQHKIFCPGLKNYMGASGVYYVKED